jgi:hypothetical protein
MREFVAIADRYEEKERWQDFFHARTAASMGGGKIQDLMVFKQQEIPPTQQQLNQKLDAVMLSFGGEDNT